MLNGKCITTKRDKDKLLNSLETTPHSSFYHLFNVFKSYDTLTVKMKCYIGLFTFEKTVSKTF